ncbi:MAG: glycoside hydrolase family 97 catalytic domain-containing protein [Prolixibacteraceae bacterium]|nr:glycoside hydrolase family 97 catalytic domain-containing protein [Prolixibacteraceae bacterium]
MLQSPSGAFVFEFYQKQLSEDKKQMYYTVMFNGDTIVLESELGLLVENQLFESALGIENDLSGQWCENLTFLGEERKSVNEIWNPIYGERSVVTDNYNEVIIQFQKFGEGNTNTEGHAGTSYDKRRSYKLNLIVRAYDQGVAFRYHIPENSNGLFMHIVGEQTNFSMPKGTMAWYERWAQGSYEYLPLESWPDESERPLTMKLPGGTYVTLTEAQMVDYCRSKFKLSEVKSNTLETSMYDKVDAITPYSTPWRVIMAAKSAGQLLANNDLIMNLNPDSQIANTSWIKPGKAMRSGLKMAEAMATVDFAAARNIQYVHLDAGWYGSEMKKESNAAYVAENRDLDLQALINYAATKNVGIFVYVNQRALYNQLDELLPLYQSWGLKGIKFGFVQIGSNRWTTWMHEAVKKAADHQLLVDVHDEYRPTGFSRTYPNLLTQEGIRGNEEMPDATHNTILPFTRYIAGAGDYTICYYNKRIKTTHAHQLALSVVYYSPLQFLFWYDGPKNYGGEHEIEFFEQVKTVWDDTKVLSGEIGGHAVVARRSGNEWFVGAITNNDARKLSVPLSFLDEGVNYVAHLYEDDDYARTKTKVGIKRFIVTSGQALNLSLKASGGAAVHLVPASSFDLKTYRTRIR